MKLTYFGVENIPMVNPGDDVAAMIYAGLASMGDELKENDVIIIAQKIISKAEDRYVNLNDISPSSQAVALGKEVR